MDFYKMQVFYTRYADNRKKEILNEYGCLANNISSLEKAIKAKPTIVKSELGSILIPDKNKEVDILYRSYSPVLSSKIVIGCVLYLYFIAYEDNIWIINVIFE